MSAIFERLISPSTRLGSLPAAVDANAALNITVVFTSVASTLSALRRAGTLANRLHAHITVIVPQVVPYPLSLTSPPVSVDFTQRRFHVLASESPIETTVRVCPCRNRVETLLDVLKPHSLVVIGGAKRWWPTQEKRLSRELRRSGHEVLFVEA
jgi:hypothetical protein